jgi:hypothetical protein
VAEYGCIDKRIDAPVCRVPPRFAIVTHIAQLQEMSSGAICPTRLMALGASACSYAVFAAAENISEQAAQDWDSKQWCGRRNSTMMKGWDGFIHPGNVSIAVGRRFFCCLSTGNVAANFAASTATRLIP